MRDTADLRVGASGSARAHSLAIEGVAIQNFVSWRGRPFVSQYGAARLRYSVAAPCDTAQERRDTVRSVRGMSCIATRFSVSRQGGCDAACPDAATRRASMRMLVATRQGAPTTLPEGGHDMAPCEPRHGVQCVAWVL